MEKVNTLVVDKTGTLTEGKPKLMSVVALTGFDEGVVLWLGASLERASGCSLARSRLAPSHSTTPSSKPVKATTDISLGLPSVNVPVLSTTSVFTFSMVSVSYTHLTLPTNREV